MSDDSLTATEIDLIKRFGKASLLTMAVTALALKQNYFDYPVLALSFAIFGISLLNSTIVLSRLVIGFLLVLVIVPPQIAPLVKESISYLMSVVHT